MYSVQSFFPERTNLLTRGGLGLSIIKISLVFASTLSSIELPAQPVFSDAGLPDVDAGGTVHAVRVAGNRVYVGGSFALIGGIPRNNLAAFDRSTGEVDLAWNPNVSRAGGGAIFALEVFGAKIYAGGNFAAVNGSTMRTGIAAFNLADGNDDGTVDPWAPTLSYSPDPEVLQVLSLAITQSRLYAGGLFDTIQGSVTRNNLAAFEHADGSNLGVLDSAWNPNVLDAPARTLAIVESRLYIGGGFLSVGGVERNGLAAVELADGVNPGSLDLLWNPDLLDPMVPLVFALATDGFSIYAGGRFASVNGAMVSRSNLAAFEPANGANAGAVDAEWDPDPNGRVEALLFFNNRIFIGGSFSAVLGSTPRMGLAAFTRAGGGSLMTVDPWNPDADDTVFSMEGAGPGLYVGGRFSTISGLPQRGLAGFGVIGPNLNEATRWRLYR